MFRPANFHSSLIQVFVGCCFASLAFANDPSPDDYARARATIDQYQSEGSSPSNHSVVVVYFTPSDREPAKDWQARITRILEATQDFYNSQLEGYGLADEPMRIARDANGQVQLHLVTGRNPESSYPKSSGNAIREEALPVLKAAGIDIQKSVLLIFCNLMNYDGKSITHHSPYYGGGSFKSGVAWQCDSEILDPLRLTDTTPLRDGEYGNITIGKHNSIFIGGVMHELGHALSLPHCRERPDQKVRGTALMGAGNRTYGEEKRGEGRGSFLTPAHALRLAAHPVFSKVVKGIDVDAKSKYPSLKMITQDQSIVISGELTAVPPAHALVAYFDPDGGGDYDAQTAVAVPDEEGRFEITGPALTPGPRGELRLVVCHANGDTTESLHRYKLSSRGIPDLTVLNQRIALRPIVDALAQNDISTARKAYQPLTGRDQQIARDLIACILHPTKPIHKPNAVANSTTSIALSDLIPNQAKVGWHQPTYNRVPDDSLVIDVNGSFATKGIYAHSPALHTYQLDNKWKRLRGTAGIQIGNDGRVTFEIAGDGKVLWASKAIEQGDAASYDVNLSNVSILELRVGDAGNGGSSDWGIWVEPMLTR